MNNVEKPNDYVNQEFEKVISKIESQSRIFGLNKINIDTTCSVYLMMTEDEISRLSPEELALAEIRLSSYSFTLQQHSNKANAIKNWANRCIRILLAKNWNAYDKYMPYDARYDHMVSSNEYANRLGEVMSEQQILIDEFAYLAQATQHVSESFGRLAKIRRKE